MIPSISEPLCSSMLEMGPLRWTVPPSVHGVPPDPPKGPVSTLCLRLLLDRVSLGVRVRVSLRVSMDVSLEVSLEVSLKDYLMTRPEDMQSWLSRSSRQKENIPGL